MQPLPRLAGQPRIDCTTAQTLGLGGQVERDRRSLRLLVRSQYVEAEYALELIGGDARGVGYLLKDRISESRISLTPSIAWPAADPCSTPTRQAAAPLVGNP